jgi:hypothetical protein
MDSSEAAIATYLTVDGQVFIAPQYDIKWEMNEGGTCPDFVALDFSCAEVVIVEVTSAANWKPLASRVAERDVRWFNPVRRRLIDLRVINSTWSHRFLGFVRLAALAEISGHFAVATDVTFTDIESAMIPWKSWQNRMDNGLPGNRRKTFRLSS